METLLYDASSSTSKVVEVVGFVFSDDFMEGKFSDLFLILFYVIVGFIVVYAISSLIARQKH